MITLEVKLEVSIITEIIEVARWFLTLLYPRLHYVHCG